MRWKRHPQNTLDRLARAIEAIAGRDQKVIEESEHVDRVRAAGAAALYGVCRKFVDDLNGRLPQPALVLDPPEWTEGSFEDGVPHLFQISLRGRLLQIEFTSTEEPYCTEEFQLRYVLQGGVRSFNQNFLERDTVDEQMIFYCPDGRGDGWHFFDPRTYRTGMVDSDYLAAEMERLL